VGVIPVGVQVPPSTRNNQGFGPGCVAFTDNIGGRSRLQNGSDDFLRRHDYGALRMSTPEPSSGPEPFRFFDNREKYLLFVTTTSEKTHVAARIGHEIEQLKPTPPAMRLFDAGTGNGVVLSHVLRHLHRSRPTVPFVVVGKEISMEDTRLTLAGLPDRLAEHPDTVVVLTNMRYDEAPALHPRSVDAQAQMQWWDIPLLGESAHDFHQQISNLEDVMEKGWQTVTSAKTGNPVYASPSVLVLYRSDRAFTLDAIIPRNTGAPQPFGYDLVLAAQPYRCRTSAEQKVTQVLAPLARSLAANGRLIVVQSTGHDPGMEIIRRIWPGEEPFATPRHLLIKELERQLNDGASRGPYAIEGTADAHALFSYHLHAMPNEISNRLSTSTALAAWNAAVYVAQIEDERVDQAMRSSDYLAATNDVVLKHGGLWFQDESFVVVRH
jgi:hypothetical protein